MPSPIDIFRTAQVLVRKHGADASAEAARRADDMHVRGNLDGAAVCGAWSPLRVDDLQLTKEVLH